MYEGLITIFHYLKIFIQLRGKFPLWITIKQLFFKAISISRLYILLFIFALTQLPTLIHGFLDLTTIHFI